MFQPQHAALVAASTPKRPVPLNFRKRVQLAKTYLDDSAPLSAARVLRLLADDLQDRSETFNAELLAFINGPKP